MTGGGEVGRNRTVSRRICRVGSGFSMYFSVLEEEFIVKKEFWPSVSTPLSTGGSLVLCRQLFFLDLEVFKKVFYSVCTHKLVHFSKFIRRKKGKNVLLK